MQKLGDYIREVDVRNKDLKVTNLMGIKIDKHFMPSVANTIGTDLSNYKVVSKNQFACNLMHVGRDEKIPIAILLDENKIIVSPAYFTFEIINSELLLPEYLMMWFSRKEFDRNAWFYTDADVRGGMDKRTLMDMQLPIPSIEQQREIVSEYETISKRIKLNEQIIKNLEATAQTLYHKMFVEGIDKENITIGCIIIPKKGRNIVRENCKKGEIPVVAGGIEPSCYHNESNTEFPVITISASGANAGYVSFYNQKIWASDCSYIDKSMYQYIYYMFVTLKINQERIFAMQEGTGQPHIYPEHIANLIIQKSTNKQIEEYNKYAETIFSHISTIKQENKKLTELQSLLLAKMGQ